MANLVNDKSIESLISASKSLRLSLQKSQGLGSALEKAGNIFEEINQRLPSLEAAVRPIRADKEALAAVGGHINRAVGPAAAVLKVFDAMLKVNGISFDTEPYRSRLGPVWFERVVKILHLVSYRSDIPIRD